MVTRDIDPKELLRGLNSNKWDMVDKKRRDPWLITTKAKLMEDIDVWTALTKGPPTIETLMLANNSLTRTSATAALPPYITAYEKANSVGY